MDKMNIVALTRLSRTGGGLFYAVSALCKFIAKKHVNIVAIGREDKFYAEDKEDWNPVEVFPYKAVTTFGFSLQSRKYLNNSTIDLVHLHGIWQDEQLASLQWQNRTKKPVVISVHGMLDSWALKNSGIKKKLISQLFASRSLANANCLHALCLQEAKAIRDFGLTNPIAIIPNGIEVPKLISNKSLSKNRRQVLFLGRIHPKKGLEELILAWDKVVKNSPPSFGWELLIAGWDDGGYQAALELLSNELGVDNSIKFIGPVFGDDKDKLLREVDLFILPSFSEGLPMTVLEAWSYSLPVIMTQYCNLPEGFISGAAIECDPTVDSIYSSLSGVLSMSNEQLYSTGKSGRELVERHFTWVVISEQMSSVYKWCVEGGKAPNCVVFHEQDLE